MRWTAEDRRAENVQRGYCRGSYDYVPPPGSVGLDYRANCPACGKRVKVTIWSRYAHHKPPIQYAEPKADHGGVSGRSA